MNQTEPCEDFESAGLLLIHEHPYEQHPARDPCSNQRCPDGARNIIAGSDERHADDGNDDVEQQVNPCRGVSLSIVAPRMAGRPSTLCPRTGDRWPTIERC